MTGPPAVRTRALLVGLFVASLVVQVEALYVPDVGAEPRFAHADKVVHVLLFAVPTLSGLLAGVPARLLVAVLLVHAGVSEVVQGALLPRRSGDPVDALADAAGVALGWGVARLWTARSFVVGCARGRW